MGTAIQLPVIETTWSDLLEQQQQNCDNADGTRTARDVQIYLSVLDETAVPYHEVDYTGPCMIVVGSESFGVSEEALNITKSVKIYIPMGKHLDMSLNAAVAGGGIMAEASRQRKEAAAVARQD